MALSLTAARKNAALDTLGAAASGGSLRVYAGSVPANADAALGGATLLASLALGAPAFASASGGVLTANAITEDSAADATGTASFFRILASDGTTVLLQGTVGTSGADLNLNTVALTTGVAVQVSSFTVSL
jgi:hypothetical protein